MNPTVSLSGLVALFGTATMIFMQGLGKPLLEKMIPGITLQVNQTLHDNLIRAVQYLVNLMFLLAADYWGGTTGAHIFSGWHWWDFMAVAIGQATVSQLTYHFGSQGGTEFSTPTTPQMTPIVVQSPATDAAGGQPAYLAPSNIPTVPR